MPSPIYRRLLNELRNRLRRALAEEVPAESEFCIFHCRKTECTDSHWLHCPRRLRHMEPEA